MDNNSTNSTDDASFNSFYSCHYSTEVSDIHPGKTPAPSVVTQSSSASHSTVRVSEENSIGLTLSSDQHLFLLSAVAKLKTSLQLSHLQGRRVGLSRQQIDNYIIDYMFDDLSGTLLKSIDSRSNVSCNHYMIDYNVFVHPPLHDTEKALLASFSHCWRLTTNSTEAADDAAILQWFNQGLITAGLPAWEPTSKRWQHVSGLLGLDSDRLWTMRSKSCSPIVHLNDQMRLV